MDVIHIWWKIIVILSDSQKAQHFYTMELAEMVNQVIFFKDCDLVFPRITLSVHSVLQWVKSNNYFLFK